MIIGRQSCVGSSLRTTALGLATVALIAACDSSDRPRSISLDDVDPCELISLDNQRLDITDHESTNGVLRSEEVPDQDNPEGATCMYTVKHRNDTGFDSMNTLGVSTITNQGVDGWTETAESDQLVDDVSRIRGFRTLHVWGTSDTVSFHTDCKLVVDVASGQVLQVRVHGNTPDGRPTCGTARDFAEAAMNSLVQ